MNILFEQRGCIADGGAMTERRWRILRVVAATVAIGSPIASHAALAMGRGYGAAGGLAAAQAAASGLLLASALPGRRWLGLVLGAALLAALAAGMQRSPEAGLLAAAGVAHAILYATLLGMFAASLRPGRTSLVTGIARRLNPGFHAGMIPYTRAVTTAWCIFFAAQLAASATLLAAAPALWPAFVTTLHAPLVAVMAIGEFLIRRWRWRHQHYTSLGDTIRGVARLRREAAARASAPGEETSR
jgi:uncharacterized membrane protein